MPKFFTPIDVAGKAGATGASRYVGATTSGAPTSGTFAVGDLVVDQNGAMWICTVAGTPGTWVGVSSPQVQFAATGTLTVRTGAVRWYAFRAMTIGGVRASVGTAPTGATVLVDVNKNGTTIFTTQGNRPSIAISGNVSSIATPDVTTLAAGDYLTVDIDQIGSSAAGADLLVQVLVV